MNEILKSLLKIQHGKVISYKTLGNYFGIHPRVIAQILSRNTEQDKYPCYKVINSDGKIGGYNLGTEEKIRRLRINGIDVVDGKVGKGFFQGK